MSRKPGRPPLPRDGTTIRRLPMHATDDEYNALMAALHADTRERFFQLDGAVNGYNIHVDEIAAERDEALAVLRELANLVNEDTDKDIAAHAAWDLADVARRILAQYEDNAVTGVTQEDSDE